MLKENNKIVHEITELINEVYAKIYVKRLRSFSFCKDIVSFTKIC